MIFGFPAYHTEQHSLDDPNADLRSAVIDTLTALSWTLKDETEGELVASTGMNMRSWGERVLIKFSPVESVSITSKCAFPFQCVDWGKNKANVVRFRSELEKHI